MWCRGTYDRGGLYGTRRDQWPQPRDFFCLLSAPKSQPLLTLVRSLRLVALLVGDHWCEGSLVHRAELTPVRIESLVDGGMGLQLARVLVFVQPFEAQPPAQETTQLSW
jgi:hypothetical protein